ncbi:MAG: hypothetical protein A3J62_03590 [Candidatus Buchananbacteria bacterium RIFCSPHIGHO2_02_FULL_38_8]|uniref:Bacterial type II secretion system protein E domain-containing protein n=2 Tax=Candidatus Buchananiibacteriota TaxID=1817903 RepID=A0A1G1Y4Z4_9BACT|nr:MAG: hypothetical protein A3J62_03590 [Candidatus Buchananbacteria bacterium RIFCSPHIGHO2_02_FULL_38_8]
MFKHINGSNKLIRQIKQEGILTKQQLKTLTKKVKRENRYLSEVLLEDITLPHEEILKVLSEFFNLPIVALKEKRVSPIILNLIPKEVAEQYSVIIFKKVKNVIYIATVSPENKQIIEFIRKKTGLEPKIFITTPREIKLALQRYKSEISEEFAKIIEDGVKEAIDSEEPAERMAQYLPIIKMVNSIIEQALSRNASDIHIEPQAKKVNIRFRIDGILHTILELPKEILPSLAARIKIISNLKIDEHRIPQDGRCQFTYGDREIAIRVSVMPTLHGPKAALRLLEPEKKQFTLVKLGLNRRDFHLLKNEIKAAQGMILVTGPTGSGKTTTLYSLLQMLNSDKINICTIEDPIEYGIEGINQTQINPKTGLTFANGLKSFIRQDPDVIMVGEIRDAETADIAINAAMTGHLVLSTLHTNNAFLAIQRFVEMGIQPYLIASVTNIIIAQRLVRKLCLNCRSAIRSPEKFIGDYNNFFDLKKTFNKLKKLNLLPSHTNFEDVIFYRPKGCPKCNHTGFQGRIGIYEVVKVGDELRKAILKDYLEQTVKKIALGQGTLTMAEDGLLKVFSGRTTIDEVLRVTQE